MDIALATWSGIGAFIALAAVVRFASRWIRLAAELAVPFFFSTVAAGASVTWRMLVRAYPSHSKTQQAGEALARVA